MVISTRSCHMCVCVLCIRKDWGRTGGGLEAGTIPALNREHTEPIFPVGIWPQPLHTTLCPKPPFPSSAFSGLLWNIPGVGWDLCNSCSEETVRPFQSNHNVQNSNNYKLFRLRKHTRGVFVICSTRACLDYCDPKNTFKTVETVSLCYF